MRTRAILMLMLTTTLGACAPAATAPAAAPTDSSATLTRLGTGGLALYSGASAVKSSVFEIIGAGLQVNPKAPCTGSTSVLVCKFEALEADRILTLPLRGIISSAEVTLEREGGRTRTVLAK